MINNNSVMASIRSDGALSEILSRFESPYIINMVKDSLGMRFRPYETSLPSLYSIESNFVAVRNNIDTTDVERLMDVREATYVEIIDEVCKYYGLEFNRDYNDDIYSSAFWIYDFFVTNYTNYFLNFFLNYIVAEKDNLYAYLNLEKFKKDKGSSTVYSKKLFEDSKLALIHSNIDLVLDTIVSADISLEQLIQYSITDNNLKIFLLNSVKDINSNVFKEKYASVYRVRSNRTDIITIIKLQLQEKIMTDARIMEQI